MSRAVFRFPHDPGDPLEEHGLLADQKVDELWDQLTPSTGTQAPDGHGGERLARHGCQTDVPIDPFTGLPPATTSASSATGTTAPANGDPTICSATGPPRQTGRR
jgi:hypothetical protein